jgi:hypothetical protein
MIWESAIWKNDLLSCAKRIRKLIQRRSPSERAIANLEKDVFMGFYIIRKLIEAHKVSTANEQMLLSCRKHPAKGKRVTFRNWHRIDELYNFPGGSEHRESLRFFCNQIIHSYVFMPITTAKTGPVASIVFSSDRDRQKHLYELSIRDIVNTFELIGNDYPANVRMTYDKAKGDYLVQSQ